MSRPYQGGPPENAPLTECAVGQEACGRSFRNTGRHAKIRARDDGWFEQRDGTWWCPDHIPDWVASWQARKAAQASGNH